MFETMIGKRVRIVWTHQSGGISGDFIVKNYSPQIQWVCLQGVSDTGDPVGNPSWTRLADIDQIEMIDASYNATPSIPITPVAAALNNETCVRASLHFDLPKANADFYIATHGAEAFMVLDTIRDHLEKSLQSPKKYKDAKDAIEQTYSVLISSLEEVGIS